MSTLVLDATSVVNNRFLIGVVNKINNLSVCNLHFDDDAGMLSIRHSSPENFSGEIMVVYPIGSNRTTNLVLIERLSSTPEADPGLQRLGVHTEVYKAKFGPCNLEISDELVRSFDSSNDMWGLVLGSVTRFLERSRKQYPESWAELFSE